MTNTSMLTSNIATWLVTTEGNSWTKGSMNSISRTTHLCRATGSTILGAILRNWSARSLGHRPSVFVTTITKITIFFKEAKDMLSVRCRAAIAATLPTSPSTDPKTSSAAANTLTSSIRLMEKGTVKIVSAKNLFRLGHVHVATNLMSIKMWLREPKKDRTEE